MVADGLAERQAMGKAPEAPEYQGFLRIKAGIAVSLADVFGDGLNQAWLLELQPGGARAYSAAVASRLCPGVRRVKRTSRQSSVTAPS